MICLIVLIACSLVALILCIALYSKYDTLSGMFVLIAILVLVLFLFVCFFVSSKGEVAKTKEQYEYLSNSDDLESRSFEIANYNESVAGMKSSVLHNIFFSPYFFEKENILKLEYL